MDLTHWHGVKTNVSLTHVSSLYPLHRVDARSDADKSKAERPCANTAAKLKELRTELAALDSAAAAKAPAKSALALPVLSQVEYESLLTGDGKSKHVSAILAALPATRAAVKEGVMSEAAFAKVRKSGAVCSVQSIE